MRFASLLLLALSLTLGTTAFAQSSSDSQSAPLSDAQPADASEADQTPSGPVLQPADTAPVVCDPDAGRLRYLEVRGSGFDTWATQHLVGNVLDASGAPQIHWSNIWVSPRGQLTLEVNLCADPFTRRPALPMGHYTVAVDQANGTNITATGISIVAPAEPESGPDETPLVPGRVAPVPPPTVAPRTGVGSLQQPYPPGAAGALADGWQLLVTGVTPDAFTGIQAAVPSATRPATDQRDFMLRVQATYLGAGTGVFGGTRLALLSTANQLTYDQVRNNCGVIPEAVVPSVTPQGQTVGGNVCFTVRAGDLGSLIAFDNQAAASERVYFGLQ